MYFLASLYVVLMHIGLVIDGLDFGLHVFLVCDTCLDTAMIKYTRANAVKRSILPD